MERLFGKAAEVHGQLMRLGMDRRRIDAEEARWFVQAVRMKLHLEVGEASMVDYAVKYLDHGLRTAQERVRTAERLVELPCTYDAMIEGQVAWSTAREVTRVMTPKTEAAWLEAVDGKTLREVEELCSGREEGDLPDTPRDDGWRKRVVTVEMTPEQFAAFEAAKAKLVEDEKKSV